MLLTEMVMVLPMLQQLVMLICWLIPISNAYSISTPTACGMAEWDGAPWQWWDNNVYAATAEAYNAAGATPYPAAVWGCLATLSNPDMSEEKGLAFTDMLEEFLRLVLLRL